MGTLEFVEGEAEMWVAWASHLQLVSEVGAVLWDEAFNLGGLC